MTEQIIHLKQLNFGIAPVVHMVQNDTGRILTTLLDDVDLGLVSADAELHIMRPDESYYSIPMDYDTPGSINGFRFDMTQALTRPGRVFCQLKVFTEEQLGPPSVYSIVSTYTFYVDVQESVDGLPVEQLGYDIYDLIDAASQLQGGGLSDTAKTLLLNILRNAIYNTDQSDNIDALEEALDGGDPPTPGPTTYSIINNLSNVTTDNAAVTITEGSSYSATLTVAEGYAMDSVSVEMGGVDITTSAYDNGDISVSSVTGNLVITATAQAIPQRTMLFGWDFTQSLVDSVNSATATLGGNATQDSTGIHINGLTDYVLLPGVKASKDVTFEIDVTSYDRQGTGHGRFWTFKSAGGQFDSGLIYRSSGRWSAYGGWVDSNLTSPTAFNGKTVVCKWKTDGSTEYYLDNELFLSATMLYDTSGNYNDMEIGSQSGQAAYNVTVTGFRVYEGVD